MTFVSGLVSISFRNLSSEELIKEIARCGLSAVEWGSDIHVPAGNLARALEVRQKTKACGIWIPEYGAYYHLGMGTTDEIENTVRSARALGTNVIRLWASNKNAASMSEEEYALTVADAKRITETYPDMVFGLECHNRSLTEDYLSALQFLRDVDAPNLKMFWQPNQLRSHAYNIEALRALLPYIISVHVFAWESNTDRFPLTHHTARWKEYLDILRNAPVETLPLMIEFTYNDTIQSLKSEADTLNGWIKEYR